VLILITVIGLGIDAYVHLHIASDYRFVRTSVLSQADLFRVESISAIAVGAWLLVRPGLWAAAAACLVGAAGVAAVTFYYYVDPGRIGPIPDMYEPVWFADKTWSFDGEAAAAAAALLLGLIYLRRRGAPTG
jgi:hypothetical protein